MTSRGLVHLKSSRWRRVSHEKARSSRRRAHYYHLHLTVCVYYTSLFGGMLILILYMCIAVICTRCWSGVVAALCQGRRRWHNVAPTSAQHLAFSRDAFLMCNEYKCIIIMRETKMYKPNIYYNVVCSWPNCMCTTGRSELSATGREGGLMWLKLNENVYRGWVCSGPYIIKIKSKCTQYII